MDSFIFSRVGRKVTSFLLAGLIVASAVPTMPVFADNENEAVPNAIEATQQSVTDKPTEPTETPTPTAPTEAPTPPTVPTEKPTTQPVPEPTTPIVPPIPGPTTPTVNPDKPTEAPTEPPTEQKVGTIETPEGNVNVDLIYSTDSAYVNGENTYVRKAAKLHLNLNRNNQPYAAYILSADKKSRLDFENNQLTVTDKLQEGSKYGLYIKVSEDADFIPVEGITIIVDYKEPQLANIKYNGKEYEQADWLGKSATIPVTFEVSDALSGVAGVSVTPQIAVGDKATESGSEAVPEFKEGKYSYNVPAGKYNQLLFLAKDNVGNSTGVTINLKRDTTPPKVADAEVPSNWSPVKFKVIDGQSGVSTVTVWAALEKPTEKGATEVEYASESATSILTPETDGGDTYSYDVPQGNYDRVIITAQDKIGNSSVSQIVIGKDEKAPDINSITYKAAETPLDRILKFITFGIYSNNNIIVTVTAKDEQSGVESISLYNGEETTETIPTEAAMATGAAGTASQSFTLSSNDGEAESFDLYVAAKDVAGNNMYDVAGNKTDKVPANKISGNVIGKASDDPTENGPTEAETAEATIPTGYSEVVVDKKAPEITIAATDPTPFSGENATWYSAKQSIKVDVTVADSDSGLNDAEKATAVGISWNRKDKSVEIPTTRPTEITTKANGKITGKTTYYGISTDELSDGDEYSVSVNAMDNAGNSATESYSFKIDTKAPTIDNIGISSAEGTKNFKQSEKDWYSGNVVLKSTITDAGSGVASYNVYDSTDGKNFTELATEQKLKGTQAIYTTNTTNNLADGKHIIKIMAVDNVGNAQSKTVTFYIDTKAPTVGNIGISPAEGIKNFKQSEKDWYSGNVVLKSTITDAGSGVASYNVYDSTDGKNFTELATEQKLKGTQAIYTTNNLADGKHIIKIMAVDNVGNEQSKTITFYIDTTIPCNYSFRFTGANTNTSKKTPTQPSQVEEKSYGYYFNSATSVTVTMEDCLTNDGALSNPRNEKSQRDFGSGIKEITIWTEGVDGNTKVYGTFSPNSKKEVTITIPAKFKGKVYAYAVDNVGNSIKSKELKISGYSPYGLIAETQDQHNQSGENHAALSMASTKYRDKDGKSLYDHTNNLVGVAVRDTYAGIYEAEITLTYGGTTERFTSTVSNDGKISSKYDGRQNGYLSSFVWDRANKNSGDNLIIQMEATIKNLPNLNDVRVQIKLTDRAGNTTTNAETFSVDTTQPEISVSWNHQGKEYYNADRVATVTIKERNFDTNRVNLVVTGGDCSNSGWAYSGGSGDDTAYTAQITFSEDADYTFDISCTDMANNENVVASGSQTSDRFTVDQTKPAISVTYDNNAVSNGNYYNKKRTATITVVEHNFNASAGAFRLNVTAKGADNKTEAKAPVISGWTNRGDVHTATISFKDDGNYSFTFNYTDLANNSASYSQKLFYIDKAAPKMSISGVEDEHAYNGNVEPEFKVSDPNCDKYYVTFTRIDVEGKNAKVTLPTSKDRKTATSADISYLISQVRDNDGIYKVEYYAKDKAGNETEKKSLVFSVNRFGSTFMYAKDQKELQQATIIDDESYVKNVTKDLVIQEVNVDALEVKTVSVHKDDELMSISEGSDYSVIVSGGKSNNKWVTNSYKFNKDLFADNGRYHIVILTQDDAKNKASNENVSKDRSRELPVKFVVDHSAPEVLITNLNFENAVNTGEEDAKEYVYGDGEGEKQLYSESSKKVIVTVKDPNLFQGIPASDDGSATEKAIAKAKEQNRYQVYLGTSDSTDQDKQYLDYEITKIENDEVELTMTISATPDKAAQNLVVTANDVVGNKTVAKVTNFTLSATWLMMFFNNVPLVIVTFSVLGLIIVGVVLLVVKKKNKRNA